MRHVLDDVAALLRCPLCASACALDGSALRCTEGHSFDVARQGYVNLLAAPGAGTADTAGMISARAEFLAGGWFDPILRAVASEVPADARVLVDAGAGTGEYLATALASAPQAVGIAIDVSVPAVRRAARVSPRAGAVVADVWQSLPVADGAADVLLNVFAPRNALEFRRVLRSGGRLIVVTPYENHLSELTSALGLLTVEANKLERLDAALGLHFRLERRTDVSGRLSLPRAAARALVGMGPSAHHVDDATVAGHLAALPEPIAVTFGVHVSSYTTL
ncbi:MAG: rRNA methyltransferase [Frankiales bacterium]|nr:rRNA methyltransferase [Frankiales bacterium]